MFRIGEDDLRWFLASIKNYVAEYLSKSRVRLRKAYGLNVAALRNDYPLVLSPFSDDELRNCLLSFFEKIFKKT